MEHRTAHVAIHLCHVKALLYLWRQRLGVKHSRLERAVKGEKQCYHNRQRQPHDTVPKCIVLLQKCHYRGHAHSSRQQGKEQMRRRDTDALKGVKHGYVVGSMLAMEQGVGHHACLEHHKGHRQHHTEHAHQPRINLDSRHAVSHKPHDILGHEPSHERIAGQQVDAALALRDAIEEENEAERQPHKHLHGLCATHALHETALAEPLPRQHEERENKEQRVRKPSCYERQEIVPERILMRLIRHLAQQAVNVFFLDKTQKLVAALQIGGIIPAQRQDKRQQSRQA